MSEEIKPVVQGVHFNLDHDNPNGAAPGSLRHTMHTSTQGFLRGQNLSVGDWIHVATSNLSKIWMGRIIDMQEDQWSRNHMSSPAYIFEIKAGRFGADPIYDNTITVTVTVTTQGPTGVSCNGYTPSPNPTTVP